MAATRAALALLWWGVEDVRLLNGGLHAWRAAGLPEERGGDSIVPGWGEDTARLPARPDLVQTLAEAKRLLEDPDGSALVSIRSWAEQCGETSGYEDIAARGRIPGDVWGHAGSDPLHMEDYEDPDGILRSPTEVRDLLWAPFGIRADKRVSFYCGTGWRASEAFFLARLLGWPRIGVLDGGWKEWTSDPANPIATPPSPPGAPAPPRLAPPGPPGGRPRNR